MKIKFDTNQEYQIQAINNTADLFEGYPLNKGGYRKPPVPGEFLSNAVYETSATYPNLTETSFL